MSGFEVGSGSGESPTEIATPVMLGTSPRLESSCSFMSCCSLALAFIASTLRSMRAMPFCTGMRGEESFVPSGNAEYTAPRSEAGGPASSADTIRTCWGPVGNHRRSGTSRLPVGSRKYRVCSVKTEPKVLSGNTIPWGPSVIRHWPFSLANWKVSTCDCGSVERVYEPAESTSATVFTVYVIVESPTVSMRVLPVRTSTLLRGSQLDLKSPPRNSRATA